MDADSINDNLKTVCNTKKTELLFVALFIRMLKLGGRCSCIVSDGVLFGTTNAHKSLRKELVENHQLQSIPTMDEYAKRFDNFMYGIMLAFIEQMPQLKKGKKQLGRVDTSE